MGWVESGWVIPYDTGCCVNVRLKADTSQLKILHENQQLNSGKTEKPNSKKRVSSDVSVNSPGNPWSQSWRSKGKLRCMLFHTKAVKDEVQWAFLLFSKVREFNFFKFIKSGIAIYAGPQAARLNTCYFHMSMDVGSNEAAYSSRFVPVESFQTQFGIFARSVVLSFSSQLLHVRIGEDADDAQPQTICHTLFRIHGPSSQNVRSLCHWPDSLQLTKKVAHARLPSVWFRS